MATGSADRPCVFSDRIAEAIDKGATITAVAIWQQNPNLHEVRAAGHTIARMREADLVRLGDCIGLRVADVADDLHHCVELDKARRLAMSLLARRDFSVTALRHRLVRRGVHPDAAEAIVQELAAEGWVDDARLARSLVDQAIDQGKATKPALCPILAKHQIDPATSELVIAETLRMTDQQHIATELARKRLATMTEADDVTRSRRLFGYLARRGFDEHVIREAMFACGVTVDDLNDRLA